MKTLKKLITFFFVLSVLSLGILSCGNDNSNRPEQRVTNTNGSVSVYYPDITDAISLGKGTFEYGNEIVISGEKITKQNIATISIAEYAGRTTTYSISGQIKVVSKDGQDCKVNWLINDPNKNLPTFFDDRVKNDTWTKFSGEEILSVSEDRSICLNVIGTQKSNLTVYLKDFEVKIFTEEAATGYATQDWLEADSIKEKYDGIFDYMGIAINYNNELNNVDVQDGIAHHFNSITMGNELKPDFLFHWARPNINNTIDFKAENGKIYKMPADMPNMGDLPMILMIAQYLEVPIRGHVLVWHNQTPGWFFKENFNDEKSSPYVSKDEMNARLEWYIKTVMDYITNWENENNNGERIVTMWDVVNEAISDNAGSQKWLREDSNWFRVYGNEEFIINAFRYANKYAPKEVKLVYNDYNTYSPKKCEAICNLIDEIRSYDDARIDAIGMQSHVKIDYPAITGENSYEQAVKKFIAKDVDVQVTELDIANGKSKYSPMLLKSVYKDYYTMFIRNRKTSEKHGIMGVTVWGVTDGGTWLDNQPEYKGYKQYPLLFNDDFTCKPAFHGILEAADSIGN